MATIQPVVLFFILGVLAGVMKSDLKIPEALYKSLSIFLLIAIGFFNLTPSLQMVLEQAQQHDTPVILVTDTLGTQIGDKATVTLAARRGPVSSFHSLTIPMTIINALLLALSSVDQEKVMSNLDKLDQLRGSLKRSSGA